MELMRPSYARARGCNGSRRHPVHTATKGPDVHSRLQPTPAFPGLWIAAVPMPRAAFACACGHSEHAAGRADVHQLLARHRDHTDRCVRGEAPSGVPRGTSVARSGRISLRKAKRPGGLFPSRF